LKSLQLALQTPKFSTRHAGGSMAPRLPTSLLAGKTARCRITSEQPVRLECTVVSQLDRIKCLAKATIFMEMFPTMLARRCY